MTGLGPFYAWYFGLRESKVFQTGGLGKTISISYHYMRKKGRKTLMTIGRKVDQREHRMRK